MSDHRDLDLLRREMRLLWPSASPASEIPHAAIAVAGPAPEPPASLLLIKSALDVDTMITSCFSYLIDPSSTVPGPDRLVLHRSSQPVPAALEAARPEDQWDPEEWRELLAGRLGPWAIGTVDDRVAALCHTPRDHAGAAEAGVWTHPDHRGHGLAAVVTAAWAGVAGPTRPWLYYSHFDDNPASGSVARKLGARPIGRIWQLRSVDSSAGVLASGEDR